MCEVVRDRTRNSARVVLTHSCSRSGRLVILGRVRSGFLERRIRQHIPEDQDFLICLALDRRGYERCVSPPCDLVLLRLRRDDVCVAAQAVELGGVVTSPQPRSIVSEG